MRIALVFAPDDAADRTYAPFGSPDMVAGLRQEGLDPMIVRIVPGAGGRMDAPRAGPGDGAPTFSCDDASLPALIRSRRPEIVHTFGSVTRLASVWPQASRSGCLNVHYVGSECGAAGAGAIRKKAWSRDGWRARSASREVAGLIGSNRATISHYVEAGFFPRARFSMLAPPPADVAAATSPQAAAPMSSLPVLGYYGEPGDAKALSLLFEGIRLTGNLHLFGVVVAASASQPELRAPSNVAFVARTDARDFVRSIDALVVPCGEDRAMPTALQALRANKVVIAPDGSSIAEALEHGRHGVLFGAGSGYELATSINEVVQSWQDRPFDYQGVASIVSRAAPDEIARTFARACRKLTGRAAGELATGAVR
jgi:glycosyltransferase involved in cell wall biosynthesis